MVKKKTAKRKTFKPSRETLAQAAGAGWYLVGGQCLLAVNPDDSSEVWTYFPDEQLWKRKGDQPCQQLRLV